MNNNLALIIFASIATCIVLLIIYYYFKERRMKAVIKKSFNQSAQDVILDKKSIILDGINPNTYKEDEFIVNQTDISPMLNNSIASKSDKLNEAKSSITTPPLDVEKSRPITPKIMPSNLTEERINNTSNSAKPNLSSSASDNLALDYILDIEFETIKTIKYLPDLTHLTNKNYDYYVFNKDGNKSLFKPGKKHATKHIQLLLSLVDNNGLINQAQINNIYNDINKLASPENAKLSQSNYVEDILKIGYQLKHLPELKLNLILLIAYLAPAKDVMRFLAKRLIMRDNYFELVNTKCEIMAIIEPNSQLNGTNDYELLSLNCAIHYQADPLNSLDFIFNFIEDFGKEFDIRLLNANQSLFNQANYDSLYERIEKYIATANKFNIKLGSPLIRRVFA